MVNFYAYSLCEYNADCRRFLVRQQSVADEMFYRGNMCPVKL